MRSANGWLCFLCLQLLKHELVKNELHVLFFAGIHGGGARAVVYVTMVTNDITLINLSNEPLGSGGNCNAARVHVPDGMLQKFTV